MARAIHPIETLTGRERDVLRLMAEGKTNPQVAEALDIRFETAKWYVSEVITKLGVASREEAATEWRRYHRLPVRLKRALTAIAGAGVLKLAIAGTGVVAVVAVTGFVAAPFIERGGADTASRGNVREEPLVALTGRGPTSLSMPASEAIDVASEQLGFRVLRPASLPTTASRMTAVEYDLGPEGLPNARRMSVLHYQSPGTRVVSGTTVPAAKLEIWQVPGVSPNGEPVAINVPGFELWKEAIPPADAALAADPRNTRVVYTAFGEEWSFVLVFEGEQPTEKGLRELLLSFR